MGYYTRFKITSNDDIEHEPLIEEVFDITFEEELKWYDYNDDMCQYSKKYPTTIFTLYGDGDEDGDKWITYYRNGKFQECVAVIIFSEFDDKLLIEGTSDTLPDTIDITIDFKIECMLGSRNFEDTLAKLVVNVPSDYLTAEVPEENIKLISVTLDKDTKTYLEGEFYTDVPALLEDIKLFLTPLELAEALDSHIEKQST